MPHHILSNTEALVLARKPVLNRDEALALLGQGEYGGFPFEADCEIDESGIRPKPLPDSFKRTALPAELAETERHRIELRLDFPCTPAELLAWCDRNTWLDLLHSAFLRCLRATPTDFQAALLREEHGECDLGRFFPVWTAYCQSAGRCPFECFRQLMEWGVMVKAGSRGSVGEGWRFDPSDVRTALVRAKQSGDDALTKTLVDVPEPGGETPLADFWLDRDNLLEVLAQRDVWDFDWPEDGLLPPVQKTDILKDGDYRIPYENSISDVEALAILKSNLGASVEEFAIWVSLNSLRPFTKVPNRRGRLTRLCSVDLWDGYHRSKNPDPSLLLCHFRFEREAIVGFSPDEKAGRYLTFAQAVGRMAAFCGEAQARNRLLEEIHGGRLQTLLPGLKLVSEEDLRLDRYAPERFAFSANSIEDLIVKDFGAVDPPAPATPGGPFGSGIAAKPEDYAHALRQDAWKAWEALSWLNGLNAMYFREGQKAGLLDKHDLIQRAIKAGRLTPEGSSPRQWIEWAREKGWSIPRELDVGEGVGEPKDMVICDGLFVRFSPQHGSISAESELLTLAELFKVLEEAHGWENRHETFRWLVETGLTGLSPDGRGISLLPALQSQPNIPIELGAFQVSIYDLERTYWLAGWDRFPWRDGKGEAIWKSISDRGDPGVIEDYGVIFSTMAYHYPAYDSKKFRKNFSCRNVICDHDPCDALVNEPLVWAVNELLRNGGNMVDWNYWVGLPHWNGREAACLIYSVDPDYFENPKPVSEGFQKIPIDELRKLIDKLARLAERTLGEAKPDEWLRWAKEQALAEEIHPRLNALIHALRADSEKEEDEAVSINVSHVATNSVALETNNIAIIFAGIYWDYTQWKSNLSDCPKWLEPARVVKGRKGKRSSTWSPIELAKLLLSKKVELKKLSRLFNTKPDLDVWKEDWASYEYQVRDFYE